MISKNECRAVILDIFLKATGEGFCEVLFTENNNERGENSNNFKQKLSKMRKGDGSALFYVYKKIDNSISNFYNLNESEIFCEHLGSDKYFVFGFEIWDAFSRRIEVLLNSEYYEYIEGKKEDFIAYILTDSLTSSIKRIISKDAFNKPMEENQNIIYSLPKDEIFKQWEERCFRNEYYTSFSDVLANLGQNKTFYKWPIDEFKITSKEGFNSIISLIFEESDSTIDSTIEKMKYESGSRKWTTLEKLFKNEQEIAKLKDRLEHNGLLAKYQVFQSRMLAAFFWENLRAILPGYVNKKNSSKIFQILFSTLKEEMPPNLEKAFHINRISQQENT